MPMQTVYLMTFPAQLFVTLKRTAEQEKYYTILNDAMTQAGFFFLWVMKMNGGIIVIVKWTNTVP